jgi:hypothetical protein
MCVCIFYCIPGMQSSAAYQSCCVCTHSFSRGVNGDKKCIYDGYRRFLVPGSRGRLRRVCHKGHTYEYKDVSTRPPPKYRDNQLATLSLRYAERSVANNGPVLGYKELPLVWNWPGFVWRRFNGPDLAHGTHTYSFSSLN